MASGHDVRAGRNFAGLLVCAWFTLPGGCGRLAYQSMTPGDGGADRDGGPAEADTSVAGDAPTCATSRAPLLEGRFTRAATGNPPATSLDIPKPDAAQEGDLLLIVFTVDNHGLGPVPPSGFAEITSYEGNARHIAVYMKFAGPSEPPTYSVTWSSDDQAIGYAFAVRGVDRTMPIGEARSTGATSDPATFDTFTTTGNDSLVIAAVSTPETVTACGGTEWSAPFVGLDCFSNSTNDHASIAFHVFPTAGALAEPTFHFFEPPDNHATALVELRPDTSLCGDGGSGGG